MLSAPLVEIRRGGGSDIPGGRGDIPGSSSANLMESSRCAGHRIGPDYESTIKPMLVPDQLNVAPAMADMRSTIERINRTAGRIDTLFSDQNVSTGPLPLQNADGASANALKLLGRSVHGACQVEDLVRDTRGIVTNGGTGLKDSIRRIDATPYQPESAGRNINEFSRTIRESGRADPEPTANRRCRSGEMKD
ncbi:hypothetical protein [Propionivibrio sp.]|uniref:hypothetical protein n=1 Tax=Propionivibrio sp. TaxID=2212460 RepID=UPI0025DAE605|nr:hypothetical protein [Propionivibrio sp.]MBK7357119.1 hypothetical protein [Propionivibrio sp.]